MTTDTWKWLGENADTISAVATAMATILAAAGLWYSARQTHLAARSTDYDNLVKLDETVRELEAIYSRAVSNVDVAAARTARNTLYNRLEILAAGVRRKLLTPQALEYARNLLIDLIALEERSAGHLQLGRVQGEALEDVQWFAKRYRSRIDGRQSEYARQDDETGG